MSDELGALAANVSLAQIDKLLATKSLAEYTKQVWNLLEPSTTLQWNWHIDLICEYLEQVFAGNIRDLIINEPPRHMKSIISSICFPTWVWIREPSHKFLTVSYASSLSMRDALKSRRILESPWYRHRWGHKFSLQIDQNVKTRYENNRGGYRIATSVGGSITGEGGDTIIVDDPHNLKEIHSDLKRQSVIDWWDEVMSTRRNDPNTSRRIIIMQRGHENDLVGHLRKRGGYEELIIPTVAEGRSIVTFPRSGREILREEGDLLWPERFGHKVVAEAKVELGSFGFAAQHQQRPSPKGGGIFKRDWWKFYTMRPEGLGQPVQSWDTASKTMEANDFSSCITGAMLENGIYILDLWHDRVLFPELKLTARGQNAKHNPSAVLVEDASSGIALQQSLKHETLIPVLPIQVDRDKVSRARAVSPTIEAGHVYLPEDAPWTQDFIDDLAKFPSKGVHDDKVDSFTQLICYFLNFVKNPEPVAGIISY